MTFDADLVVIGSGPAGEKAAAQAAFFGKRVVVIEREEEPGGAAVHTGTLPSKTLRETALFLAGHRQRELYGVSVAMDAEVAVQKILARTTAVTETEVGRIRWNLKRHGVQAIRGNAHFCDPHTLAVDGPDGERSVSGEFVLVATGSRPYHPAGVDFGHPAIDDSDTILGMERLPGTLAVIGGGVIGCEYACMFAELGVEVALLEPRANLLPFIDIELRRQLIAAMLRRGIDVRLGAAWKAVGAADARVRIDLVKGEPVYADRVLMTAGRTGATSGLGLEELGVRVDDRGYVVVNEHFRTAVPSILAAGDVVGFPGLASTSMEQGRVAVCQAFGFEYKRDVAALSSYGVYTIPEIGSVGLTEEAAEAEGLAVVCGRSTYALNARAQIVGAQEGLIKLVFNRESRRLVGAHVFGEQATELVHTGQAVMSLGGTVESFISMVFNFPTLSECYKYAAYDALGRW